MRRTFVLFALALASIAAAAVAAALRPARSTVRPAPTAVQSGALRLSAQLDHRYLSEQGGGEAYLQVDLIASGEQSERHRVPVNAVLILDRSGSMQGPKMERAKDAARALVAALGADDRLSVVEFSSAAHVALPCTAMTAEAKDAALAAIEALFAGGGTNMSSAFDVATAQLAAGHAQGRVDKVFLASDGQANEGFSDRPTLMRIAARDFKGATLSTFGLGDDYDEDFMNALAASSGGRSRYIASPEVLAGAFRDELSRAASVVARNVRVRVSGAGGASVDRVLGYEVEGGWVRLPDFAAGEERRVLVKLSLPSGKGEAELASVELAFEDAQGEARQASASASATFTSESARLEEPAGPAAAAGARAEMAEMASHAASLRESGRRDEAKVQLMSLRRVAQKAAAAAPTEAAGLASVEASYERDVEQVDQPGGAASKKLKEKTFDAVRAPVAGW